MKTSRPKQITVAIIEDHLMFREQLGNLISQAGEMKVVGEADNVSDGLELLNRIRPSIAVVDISLKGSSGLELVKQLRAQGNEVPVLVLSMHDESLYAERALRAGANGYITKHEASIDVMNAIQRVIDGELYLNPEFMGLMMNKFMAGTSGSAGDPVHRLADRELEVFRLIGRGLTTREIGDKLGLEATTVDTYRARIKDKLGLKNMARLQLEASRWMQDHE